jgi:hypothetical protein
VRRLPVSGLVHPPWFGALLNDLGAEYFRGQGFEVVDAQLADLPDDPGRIGSLSAADVLLDNPTVCIQGDRVTHLVFPVVR